MEAKELKKRVKQTEEDKELLLTIDVLNKSYHYHKNVLLEDEYGITHYEHGRLRCSRRSVSRIESTVSIMPEREKLFIEAEILENKMGTKWYREYYSTPSYYRIRKIAYKMFLDMVNK